MQRIFRLPNAPAKGSLKTPSTQVPSFSKHTNPISGCPCCTIRQPETHCKMLSIQLINHLLSHNPEVCAQLAGYNGITIALQTGSLNIVGRINAHGLLEASTQHPDSTLILHNDALPNILRGAMPQFSDLAIEGDTTIGINLLSCCSQLRYTPQQDLQRIFGEDQAHALAQKAQQIGQTLQNIGQFFRSNSVETFGFQAAANSPSSPINQEQYNQLAHQLNDCQQQLSNLQRQIEHTNRRLDSLERKMRDYDVD